MDNRRYILLTFLIGAALVGMSVRGLGGPFLALVEVGDPVVLGGVKSTSLAGVASGVVGFMALSRHQMAVSFTGEVIEELRKVVWPDREETVRSTIVVLSFSVIVAGIITIYDQIWGNLVQILFADG
jgi:preprotein translocase SecE subunit